MENCNDFEGKLIKYSHYLLLGSQTTIRYIENKTRRTHHFKHTSVKATVNLKLHFSKVQIEHFKILNIGPFLFKVNLRSGLICFLCESWKSRVSRHFYYLLLYG